MYDDVCHLCRGPIGHRELRIVLDLGDEMRPLYVFHRGCFDAFMTASYGARWMTSKATQWVLQIYAPTVWWFKLLRPPEKSWGP